MRKRGHQGAGTADGGRSRRARRLGALAVLVAAAVSGCTGGGEPGTTYYTPPSRSQAPETPTPTFTPAPTQPAAARQNTLKGAEAFVRYFLTIYEHAYAASDADPIRDVTLNGCRFCQKIIDDVTQQKERGEFLRGGVLTPVRVLARPDSPPDRTIVDVTFSETASRLVDAEGKTVETYSSSDVNVLAMAVRWDPVQGWKIIAASSDDETAS